MKISIIGGGAAGLFAAAILSQKHTVELYEKGKRLGSKFLVAGHGGFNLTNVADGIDLVNTYRSSGLLDEALLNFGSAYFRQQLADWNIPTFVGSSGRVFPEKGIKPIDVLQKIIQVLNEQGVQIHYHHKFVGFNEENMPLIQHEEQTSAISSDAYIFALGGASWSKTGSDGQWLSLFEPLNITTQTFQASNCGLHINWAADFLKKFEGTPLKNIAVSAGESTQKGEAVITQYGLEGNAIYPIIHEVRQALNTGVSAKIALDIKPHSEVSNLLAKAIHLKPKQYKYTFKLSPVKLALLKAYTDKTTYLNPESLIKRLKHLALEVTALRPIEESISTTGGISVSALDTNYAIKGYPNVYVIGEMIDWDAPTGGFLLQGCFSMARQLAEVLK